MKYAVYFLPLVYIFTDKNNAVYIHSHIFFPLDTCHSLMISFGSKSLTKTPLRLISIGESRLSVVNFDLRSILMQFILLNPLS